jgi:hypothetical protein
MADDKVADDADDRLKLVKADDAGTPRPTMYRRPPEAKNPEAARARAETESAWPSLADPYKAAGNPDNDSLPRLVVVMGRDRFKPGDEPAYYTLQYYDMGTGEYGFAADGQWFRIPFHEAGGTRLLSAQGRNILRIGDSISLGRMPWIRMADRDFRPGNGQDADAPIFTRITVEVVKEEE